MHCQWDLGPIAKAAPRRRWALGPIAGIGRKLQRGGQGSAPDLSFAIPEESMKKILAAALFSLAAMGATAAPPANQFIDNPPTMTPDARREGASLYVAPGRSLKGFDRVALDPVLVWYSADSDYQGIDPTELSAVTTALRDAIVNRLEPKYAVVNATGPGVLQVRLAITDVVASKKKKGILGYTPVGLVVGAAKNLASAGPNISLASANVEAEILDADGERLAVIREPLLSGDSKSTALTWDRIGEAVDAYGQRLRARLDADNPQ